MRKEHQYNQFWAKLTDVILNSIPKSWSVSEVGEAYAVCLSLVLKQSPQMGDLALEVPVFPFAPETLVVCYGKWGDIAFHTTFIGKGMCDQY